MDADDRLAGCLVDAPPLIGVGRPTQRIAIWRSVCRALLPAILLALFHVYLGCSNLPLLRAGVARV